jgi:hypothetical protein
MWLGKHSITERRIIKFERYILKLEIGVPPVALAGMIQNDQRLIRMIFLFPDKGKDMTYDLSE